MCDSFKLKNSEFMMQVKTSFKNQAKVQPDI